MQHSVQVQRYMKAVLRTSLSFHCCQDYTLGLSRIQKPSFWFRVRTQLMFCLLAITLTVIPPLRIAETAPSQNMIPSLSKVAELRKVCKK